MLLEAVHQPFQLIPFEPRPLADPGEGHRTVRREEALHERLEGVLGRLRRRIEGHVQVPRLPSVALEFSDHIHVVVELVEGFFHLLLLLADLGADAPDVDAVRSADHLEDLRLELRQRTAGERGEE